MKKIIIICMLLTATIYISKAQAPVKTFAKTEFSENVAELKVLLDQNKVDQAKKKWEHVHDLMLAEFAEIKAEIKNAVSDKNAKREADCMSLLKSKVTAYQEIVKHRSNLSANSTELFAGLDHYMKIPNK